MVGVQKLATGIHVCLVDQRTAPFMLPPLANMENKHEINVLSATGKLHLVTLTKRGLDTSRRPVGREAGGKDFCRNNQHNSRDATRPSIPTYY